MTAEEQARMKEVREVGGKYLYNRFKRVVMAQPISWEDSTENTKAFFRTVFQSLLDHVADASGNPLLAVLHPDQELPDADTGQEQIGQQVMLNEGWRRVLPQVKP